MPVLYSLDDIPEEDGDLILLAAPTTASSTANLHPPSTSTSTPAVRRFTSANGSFTDIPHTRDHRHGSLLRPSPGVGRRKVGSDRQLADLIDRQLSVVTRLGQPGDRRQMEGELKKRCHIFQYHHVSDPS